MAMLPVKVRGLVSVYTRVMLFSEALVAGVAVRSSRLFAIVMSVPGTKASPSKEKVVPDNNVIPLLPVLTCA